MALVVFTSLRMEETDGSMSVISAAGEDSVLFDAYFYFPPGVDAPLEVQAHALDIKASAE